MTPAEPPSNVNAAASVNTAHGPTIKSVAPARQRPGAFAVVKEYAAGDADFKGIPYPFRSYFHRVAVSRELPRLELDFPSRRLARLGATRNSPDTKKRVARALGREDHPAPRRPTRRS